MQSIQQQMWASVEKKHCCSLGNEANKTSPLRRKSSRPTTISLESLDSPTQVVWHNALPPRNNPLSTTSTWFTHFLGVKCNDESSKSTFPYFIANTALLTSNDVLICCVCWPPLASESKFHTGPRNASLHAWLNPKKSDSSNYNSSIILYNRC